MSARFEGKHVVVTGGTGALGTVVVGRLLDEGASCHIPCHSDSERARFPHAQHPRVRLTPGVDLRDERGVEGFYGQLSSAPLWASIHIAGGFGMAPIERTTLGDFETQMGMNVATCFLCCREAVKRMSGQGRIVNVAARPGLEPRNGAGMVAYTAAKAAVAAMTQALAQEVVARGILVNAVVPSIMNTPANRAAMPDADFGVWARLEDVASAAVYLASPENGGVRGALVTAYAGS